MITKTQWKEIEKFSFDFYKKKDETHGVSHMKRTMRLAKLLAEKERANMEICIASCMLHQFHDAKIVRKFLEKIKVNKKIAADIITCIYWNDMKRIRKGRQVPIDAKVVFDADKLQMIGPFGFTREVASQIVRDGKEFSAAVRRSMELQKKAYALLQTKSAKQIAKKQQETMKHFFRHYEKLDKVIL